MPILTQKEKIVKFKSVLITLVIVTSLLQNSIAQRYNVLVKSSSFQKARTILSQDRKISSIVDTGHQFSDFLFFQIISKNTISPDSLKLKLKKNGISAIVEPNYIYKLDFDTTSFNDSLYQFQWYFNFINADYFYKNIQSVEDRKVTIAVIDAGIDYNHEDLQSVFWINDAEDLNHNHKLDSLDLDGIDQDGNGYVDDVIGYDFVDAPDLPAPGDYLEEDPFPDDEFYPYGHGTGVAGIIAAIANNHKGIAGISNVARIMNLRAGSASGYLETDDIVKAILYAVQNGADIINMSFGDVYASEILSEVVKYALQKGVIVVASAGNENSSDPHYPAAFNGVVSVGALDQTGNKALFSNYGSWISCTAPGQDMMTTAINDSYHSMSGTSFSAPVVSALFSLMTYISPEKDARELVTQLLQNSDDIIPEGFDSFNGFGVPREPHIFLNKYSQIELQSPSKGQTYPNQPIPVVGSIYDAQTREYWFELESATEVLWISPHFRSFVFQDTIIYIPQQILQPGDLTLTLKLQNFNEEVRNYKFPFKVISDSFPAINIHRSVMIDKDIPFYRYLINSHIQTSLGITLLDSIENPVISMADPLIDSIHVFYSDVPDVGAIETKLFFPNSYVHERTINGNQIKLQTQVQNLPLLNRVLLKKEYKTPEEYVFSPQLVDLDSNGSPEVVVSNRSHQYSLEIMEIERETDFIQLFRKKHSEISLLPYGLGDVNGNGQIDLLAGFAGSLYLFSDQSLSSNDSILRTPVYKDVDDCWPVEIRDVNQDGINEVIVRKNNRYEVWAFDLNWHKRTIQEFSLDTTLIFGIPRLLWGKFFDDGDNYSIISDNKGFLYIFRILSNGKPELFRTIPTPYPYLTNYATVMDIDQDKKDEIVFLYQNDVNMASDQTVQDASWSLVIGKWNSEKNNFQFTEFVMLKGVNFHQPVSTGIVGDTTNKRIWISTGQNGYGVSFLNGQPQEWYVFPGTNIPVIFTPSFNGIHYFMGMEENQTIIGEWGNSSVFTQPTFDFYQLNDSLAIMSFVPSSDSRDTFLIKIYYDTTLIYSKEVWDSSVTQPIKVFQNLNLDWKATLNIKKGNSFVSIKEKAIQVHTHPILQISLLDPKSKVLQLSSSVPLNVNSMVEENFRLSRGNTIASKLITLNNNTSVLLFFPASSFESTKDTLIIQNVRDELGYLLEGQYEISFPEQGPNTFYPILASLRGDTVWINFNREINNPDLSADYFEIIPSRKIQNVEVHSSSKDVIKLIVEHGKTLFGFGTRGIIRIHPFYDDSVLMADGHTISLPISNLNDVFEDFQIFPNPTFASRHDQLILYNIPYNAVYEILNINGQKIYYGVEDTGSGGVTIDLKKRLEKLPTGVYIIAVRYDGKTKIHKWFYIK